MIIYEKSRNDAVFSQFKKCKPKIWTQDKFVLIIIQKINAVKYFSRIHYFVQCKNKKINREYLRRMMAEYISGIRKINESQRWGA